MKWTHDNTGFVRMWKNGTSWVELNERPTNCESVANYFKIGFNKWTWTTPQDQALSPKATRVMWVDAVRIGDASATYEDVKPGN